MNGPTQTPHTEPKVEPTFSANTVSGSTSLTVQPALTSNITSYVTTELLEARMGQMKAEMKSEMSALLQPMELKLGGVAQTSTIWKAAGTIVLAVFGSVGAIFAILSWAGDRVDGGVAAASSYNEEIVAAQLRDKEQDKADAEQAAKLDRIINVIEKQK